VKKESLKSKSMTRIKFKDTILYEDENYIVINKPPYISSLEDRSSSINILNLARGYNDQVHLCHRLDKETSGCLIIAKNEEAYRHTALQFQERKVNKRYQALVEGVHNFKENSVNVPIFYRSGGDARIDFRHGNPSQTYFNTLKAYRNYTHVEANPVTGRLHQIRVHLAHIRAPIVGDLNYGGRLFYLSSIKHKYKTRKGEDEQPLIKRFALHASVIIFQSISGKEIEVSAPFPKDFGALIRQLERYG